MAAEVKGRLQRRRLKNTPDIAMNQDTSKKQ